MKKYKLCRFMLLVLLFLAPAIYLSAQQKAAGKKIFQPGYNLIPKHSADTQYYVMESRLLKYALDGTRLGTDVYRVYLRCVPARAASSKGDEYTCLKFVFQAANSPARSIPSLSNWKYFFSLASKKDDKGQLFGIDHGKFEKLVDDSGKVVPLEHTFHVYNAFVDFHSMSVFAEKPDSGKGVQDLKSIGEKVIHGASFSQPEENLGSQVAKGSYFKNGEVTLTFKGLSSVNKKTCALIEYDSGESSFNMLMKPMANMEIKTKGSSHYFGDIYKDLEGGWIQKATLHEFVISETIVPGMADKINSVIERAININNVPSIEL